MEKVHKCGKMAASIPGTGRLTKLTVKVDLYMLMEMPMRVTGITIKPREEELMNMLMVQNMSETGRKIDNMVMVLRLGQTMRNMKEITNMVKSTALALSNGLMGHLT